MTCEKPPNSTKIGGNPPENAGIQRRKPRIQAKSAKSPQTPPKASEAALSTRRAYRLRNADKIKARTAVLYGQLTLAERTERRWRQEAKPPTPTAGSTRSRNPRTVDLAAAYCEFSDLDEVVRIYKSCAIMNELGLGRYHVDHTIPITSRLVCGLHTHTNLRVVSHRENRRKGNWLWPQMWPQDWSTMDLLLEAP